MSITADIRSLPDTAMGDKVDRGRAGGTATPLCCSELCDGLDVWSQNNGPKQSDSSVKASQQLKVIFLGRADKGLADCLSIV